MQKGSYHFETLTSKNIETDKLLERAQMRLDGFTDLLTRHVCDPINNILEIGCAQGLRTYRMATHFSQAQVIGIDRSPELLKVATEHYDDQKNLSFQIADLYELPFEDNSFDFIYVRLVFMHLTDPRLALASLRRILRPGGRLLIEDADRDCMLFEPAPSGFNKFWQKVQTGQRQLGGDPNVGRKLANYLKLANFQDLKIEVQPIIGGNDEVAFLIRTLLPSLNLYLESKDQAQGANVINELEQLTKSTNVFLYHFWFTVSGAK